MELTGFLLFILEIKMTQYRFKLLFSNDRLNL
jgi:hypothetical protein